MNQVNLVGNVGQNPELRYTRTGIPVCDFSMAVNERWTGGDGSQNERTIWCRITTWNGLAETVAQYLSSGRQVRVTGKLGELRPWIDQDGNARCSQEVTANEVQFLGSSNSMSNQPHAYEPETANQAQRQSARRAAAAPAAAATPDSVDDDSEAAHEQPIDDYSDLAKNDKANELETSSSKQEAEQDADESHDASTDKDPAEADTAVVIEMRIQKDQAGLPPRISAEEIKAAKVDKVITDVLLTDDNGEPLVEYVEHVEDKYNEGPDGEEDEGELVEMSLEEIIQHDVSVMAGRGAEIISMEGAEEEDDASHVSEEPVEPAPPKKVTRKAKSKATPTGAAAVAMLASANGVAPGIDQEEDDDIPF